MKRQNTLSTEQEAPQKGEIKFENPEKRQGERELFGNQTPGCLECRKKGILSGEEDEDLRLEQSALLAIVNKDCESL